MFLLRLHPVPAAVLVALAYLIGQSLLATPLDVKFGWLARALGILALLAYPAFVAWQLEQRLGAVPGARQGLLLLALCVAVLFSGPGLPFVFPLLESQDVLRQGLGIALSIAFVAAYFHVLDRAAESLGRAESRSPSRLRLAILTFLSFAFLPIGIVVIQKRLRRLLASYAAMPDRLRTGPSR